MNTKNHESHIWYLQPHMAQHMKTAKQIDDISQVTSGHNSVRFNAASFIFNTRVFAKRKFFTQFRQPQTSEKLPKNNGVFS